MAEHGDGDPMTRLLERAPPADPLARRELLREVERGLFGRETPLPHVGRYRLVRRIGAGGQGVVYVAHDPELDRHVALKLLLSGHAGDEARPGRSLLDARAGEPQDAMPPRLRREAQAMAKLSHPNVAAVYEVGWHDDTAFIAMELVEGRMLRDWLDARPRRVEEILDAMIQAGRGLAAAHDRELVHRDFKPQNVMVAQAGVAKVLDFGLATLERYETQESIPPSSSAPSMQPLTETGTVMGTPAYMAPEQRAGGVVDARSDQYAYCVVLHEALWGVRPGADTEGAIARSRRVPSWLVAAMRRGLASDPAERWPSMNALLHVLAVGRRRPRARRAAVAAGSVLAIAVVGGSLWGMHAVQRSRAMAACEREGATISDVLDEARANRIAAAFEATGIAYAADTWSRARTRLAGLAQQWHDTRTHSCARAEIEHTLPPALLDASRRCLDEQRDELDALLRWLERPDANVVNAAATAVASLPRPEICVDEARLRRQEAPPVDPELREHVVAVRARLAHVRAAIEVARYDDALGEAEAVLKEASSEWPALVAQTKLLIGLAQQELGRYDDAHAALQEAFFTAGAAGRDDIAADAATVLVTVTGRLGRDAEGLQWGRLAQMLIDRSGQPDDGALLDNMGLAHHRLGDHTRALELVEQALVVRQNALGEGHPAVAAVLDSVAVVRTARGEHALALEASERALAIREETLGPGHPEVIDARKRRAEAESWLRERRNR